MSKFYKLTKKFDFIDIPVSSIIEEDNGRYKYNNTGKVIPDPIIDTIKSNLVEINPEFPVGSYALYRKGLDFSSNAILVRITNFETTRTVSRYYYDVEDVFHNNTIIRKVAGGALEKTHVYWFVNSHGSVSQTYYGRQPQADAWRMATKNMFATKEEATNYHDSILYPIPPDLEDRIANTPSTVKENTSEVNVSSSKRIVSP